MNTHANSLEHNDELHKQEAINHLQGTLKFSNSESPVNVLSLKADPEPPSSATRQLLQSGSETTGKLFDGSNKALPSDAVADGRLLNVATPAAQPLDEKYAGNTDYQVSSAKLAKDKTAAELLNNEQDNLEALQKANPTPENQIKLSDLSARVIQANGAVRIDENNITAVKKRIDGGPAIIVGDTSPQKTPQ